MPNSGEPSKAKDELHSTQQTQGAFAIKKAPCHLYYTCPYKEKCRNPL